MFYRKKGFTLLELMIVVIIVGILASLAMPRFIKAADRAREAEAKNMLGAIRSSQLRYNLEFGKYSQELGALDITVDAQSKYYDYTTFTGTATHVGQAEAGGSEGFGGLSFQIDADGDINEYTP